MTTTLIITVGGSHQPVLTSIKQHRPGRVHFLCSADQGKAKGSYTLVTGEGKVIKSDFKLDSPDQPNLVTLAGLAEDQFVVHLIERYDDLNACYAAAADTIAQARQENPQARLLADYTAGTKSMSAGLAAAALDDGRCELGLVVGQRSDLVKVVNRTEFARRISVSDAQTTRRLQAARDLTARYDYAAAEQLLRGAAAELDSPTNLERLQRGIALCSAFDSWDRFEHVMARECMAAYQSDFVSHWRMLGALSRAQKGHGFEWVEDLLHNAARRYSQGRYDDAVGRIYRAIELTAQVWLQERHGVETSNVDLLKVPEARRAALERNRRAGNKGEPGPVLVGLRDAWDLIATYPDDPVGALYMPLKTRLMNFLSVRNSSLFAHGFRPVSRADHDQHIPLIREWLEASIGAGLEALGRKRLVVMEQFPTDVIGPVR